MNKLASWDVHQAGEEYNRKQHQDQLSQDFRDTRREVDRRSQVAASIDDKRRKARSDRKILITRQEERAFTDPKNAITHLIYLGLFVASYVVTYLLIYLPIKYLVEQNLGSGSWQATVGLLMIPIVIIVLQVGVSLKLSEVKGGRYQKAESIWILVGYVLIIITPVMLLATFLAEFQSVSHGLHLYDYLLLAGKMGLAFVTDVSIVRNGEKFILSLAYLWFIGRKLYIEQRIERLDAKIAKQLAEVEHLFHNYWIYWLDYQQYTPDAPLSHIRFNQQSDQVLRDCLGYEPNQAPFLAPGSELAIVHYEKELNNLHS